MGEKKQLNEEYLLLLEASRRELIAKSKKSDLYAETNRKKGKNRYERRKYSKIESSVSQYNDIDMNAFFKKDLLIVGIKVHGETSDYIAKIKFSGILEELREAIKRNNNKFEFKVIIVTLTKVFNFGDVFVHCSCPDWKYRQAYWGTVHNYNSGEPQTSNGMKIANPNDTKGAGCKHVNLVISNANWLMKVASVINNYVKYAEKRFPKNYNDIIFPALYGIQQIQLFKNTSKGLGTSQRTLDIANRQGRTSGRFQKGNTLAKDREKKKDALPKEYGGRTLFNQDEWDEIENKRNKITGNNPSLFKKDINNPDEDK